MSRAGGERLDRRIQIWRHIEIGRDAYNVPIYQWQLQRTINARVRHLRAAERYDGSQIFAMSEVAFTTRWFTNLQPTDLIVFDGKQYDITGIAEIGRSIAREIAATWRQNNTVVLG